MPKHTDWTHYYESPFPASALTRRITARVITAMLKRAGFPCGASVTELGGGNSFFCEPIMRKFRAAAYLVLDSNPRGVDLFNARHTQESPQKKAVLADIFDPAKEISPSDLVLSVGLVEHFNDALTRRAIQIHFELAKPGGLILITFPCPTIGYRIVRSSAECFGMWRFPDERPLILREAADVCSRCGEVLETKLNRAILLTQGIILARKPKDSCS